MRRLALIIITFGALTASGWSRAQASRQCLNDEAAPAAILAEMHDCCRAHVGATHAPEQGATTHHATEATHAPHVAETRAARIATGTHCAKQAPTPETKADSCASHESSCLACCAGSPAPPVPTTTVALESNRAKRAPVSLTGHTQNLLAVVTAHVSTLAPAQHAPPGSPPPRHILHRIFLI